MTGRFVRIRRLIVTLAILAGAFGLAVLGAYLWVESGHSPPLAASLRPHPFAEIVARGDTVAGFRPSPVLAPLSPISDFEVQGVADANRQLAEDDLVLGVVVNGEARAYPINFLTGPTREVLNDELGGKAIAATW